MRLLQSLKYRWHLWRNTRILETQGVRVRTGKDDIPEALRIGLFKGRYEDAECMLAERILSPGSRVLEIGTGIGLISLVATRIAGQGNVLSCEANPKMEETIRANYALNGWEPNLRMHAVTADGRDVTFFRNDNVISSSVYERDTESTEITVPSVAVDTLIHEHRPSAILMDVEGAELELLKTADLAGVQSLIIEMHPHIIGDAAVEDIVQTLAGQGFRVAECQRKTYLITR